MSREENQEKFTKIYRFYAGLTAFLVSYSLLFYCSLNALFSDPLFVAFISSNTPIAIYGVE